MKKLYIRLASIFCFITTFCQPVCLAIAPADVNEAIATLQKDGYSANNILQVWTGGTTTPAEAAAGKVTSESEFKSWGEYFSKTGADGNSTVPATAEEKKKALAGKHVYVISHGLKDTYDTGWIRDTAAAIMEKDPDALVVSIDWDKYSGLADNTIPNLSASTWINAVSKLVAEELNADGVQVECAIGHSYGAHMVASITANMDEMNPNAVNTKKLLAMDPAEEDLTWTGTSGEVKKSHDWQLKNTVVESYKSSAVLGAESMLGDYNYLLVETGAASPKDTLQDWKTVNGNLLSGNHGVAANWIGEQIRATGKIGSWYNDAAKSTGEGYYNGIINADNVYIQAAQKYGQDLFSDETKQALLSEIYRPTEKYTSWSDAFFDMGLNTSDWKGSGLVDKNGNPVTSVTITYPSDEKTSEGKITTLKTRDITPGTVLNPAQEEKFKQKYQKAADGSIYVDANDNSTTTVNTDGSVVTTNADGSTVRINADGSKNVTDASGNTVTVSSDGTDLMDSIYDDVTDDSAVSDGINDAVSGNTDPNSITGVIDSYINGNGTGDSSIQDAINNVINSSSSDTSTIFDKIKNGAEKLVRKYVTLATMEKLAQKGFELLLNANPQLKNILTMFNLTDIKSIIALGKDIFNTIKGLLGGQSLLSLLQNSTVLKGILKTAISIGLSILKNLALSMMNKLIGKIADWLSNMCGKILGKFGISANIDFEKLLSSAASSGLDKAAEWAKAKVDGWLAPASQQNNTSGTRSAGSVIGAGANP